MSDSVSGSISRGRDEKQVTVTFSGKLKPNEWDELFEQLKALAEKVGIGLVQYDANGKVIKKPRRS